MYCSFFIITIAGNYDASFGRRFHFLDSSSLPGTDYSDSAEVLQYKVLGEEEVLRSGGIGLFTSFTSRQRHIITVTAEAS